MQSSVPIVHVNQAMCLLLKRMESPRIMRLSVLATIDFNGRQQDKRLPLSE